MLVLSRHKNEAVMIGDQVKVVVVEIRGDKVRLGFEGPHEIKIHRQEVFDAIARQNSKATQVESVPEVLSEMEDGYEFCSKEKATEHYDFIAERWVSISRGFVELFDCRLYRRPVKAV